MKRWLIYFLILIIASVSLLGCSKNKDNDDKSSDIVSADNNDNQEKSQDDSQNTDEVEYLDFVAYLKHKDMSYIFGERFEIKSDDPLLEGMTIEEIALDKLFNYDEGSYVSPVPEDTKVLSLEKKGKTIYLDLSKEFIDNMPVDKELIRMAIDSIVNTLTFFPENETVIIKVEGETIKEINGVSLDKDFSFSSEFIPDK